MGSVVASYSTGAVRQAQLVAQSSPPCVHSTLPMVIFTKNVYLDDVEKRGHVVGSDLPGPKLGHGT
jgi:hypothetical protein